MIKRYDYNLAIIGAGAGGLVSAYIAAAVKAKVVLIEQGDMGGDCLNSGCVPSKALIHMAAQSAPFSKAMEHVQASVAAIAPHDSTDRYESLGVECVQGRACLTAPREITITQADGNTRILTAKAIIIASGAAPFIPPIEGLETVKYHTSETIWGLKEAPKRLAILGGGPIGCEMAQAFARLGSEVTVIEMQSQLLSQADPEVSSRLHAQLAQEQIRILTQHQAIKVTSDDATNDGNTNDSVPNSKPKTSRGRLTVTHTQTKATQDVPFDALLVAIGRKARTQGFGLQEHGIMLTPHGTIAVDAYLRSHVKHIYAVGDVAGPYQFTHTAAHMAWYATVNALFSPFKRVKIDWRVVPHVTFTAPEIAQVGLNEREAKAQNIPYELTEYDLVDFDRAIIENATAGCVRVLTKPGSDAMLGATIMAPRAGEMLQEFTLAMRHGLGLNKILATMHPYPSWADANKLLAGRWKQAHAPQWALRLLQRLHRWRL